jgi:hypothetical protein
LLYLVEQDPLEYENILNEYENLNQKNQLIYKIKAKNLDSAEEILDYIDEINDFQ